MEIRKVRGEYYVNEHGDVFDRNMVKLFQYKNTDGYLHVTIHSKSESVHRLVLESFYGIDNDVERIYGNHIDGNNINNHYTNLDWVTSRENNIHSELIRCSNRRPKLYSLIDGVPKELFYTLNEVASVLKRSLRDVWLAIKLNKEIEGRFLIYLNIKDKIPVALLVKNNMEYVSEKRPIKMKSILSGTELHFESIHDAAKYFNTKSNHIWYSIKRGDYGNKRFFKKEYQVSYENEEFDIINENDINKAINYGAKNIIAYNFACKKYIIYKDAKTFYTDNNITKSRVTKHLVKNNIKRQGDWIFLYLNQENTKRLKEFVNRHT